MTGVRYMISSRRILLRPVLEDFDRCHEFYISREQ
jgi:hypothetical protein